MQEGIFAGGEVALNYSESPPNGPPLLLLHGLTFRWQSFLPLIPELSRHWHVYALDFRGHGKSGRGLGRYGFQNFVNDTVGFARERIGEPTVIFGHSLGGAVGLFAAARLGRVARALIVADNFLYRDSFIEITSQPILRNLFCAVQALAVMKKSANELLPVLSETVVIGPDGDTKVGALFGNDLRFLQRWAESIAQLDPRAVDVFFEVPAPEAFDGDGMLRNTSSPIMLLKADSLLGGILPDKDIERALSIRPQTIVRRFNGLGHMMHMQDPKPILPIVVDFLGSLLANSLNSA